MAAMVTDAFADADRPFPRHFPALPATMLFSWPWRPGAGSANANRLEVGSMNKFFRALLATAAAAASWQAAGAPATVFTQLRASVLALEVVDEHGARIGAHTAVAVAPARAVSACDVLDGAPVLRLMAADGPIAATVLARDSRRNLCLLSLAEGAPALPVAAAAPLPAAGVRVYAISNASGLGVGISEGLVSGIRSLPAGDYIQFTAPISPGSEGGALVDEQGRLVGIIDYRRRDGQNVNFAAAAAWIGEIEQRAEADGARQALRDGAARLAREQRWTELASLAGDWHRRHGEDADALRWQATAAGMLGDAAAEERAWRELGRLDPASVQAGVGLARALLRRGEGQEALALARSLLARRQEDGEVWAAIGDAEGAAGTPERAEEAYRQALSLNPWLWSAHQGLIALAQRRGDRAGVTAGWRGLAQLYPELPGVQLKLALAYVQEGRPARAWPLLQRLPEGDADGADAWYARGVVLFALGRPVEAITAFRRALERQPAAPAWAWAGIGSACFDLKRYPEAIEAYRQAQALEPANDAWHYRLAMALKDGGHGAEAIAIDRQLVARHPRDIDAWRQLGYANGLMGRSADAIAALERSLELEPRQAQAWRALMELYHSAGRPDDVRRAYDTLRGIDTEAAEKAYRWLLLPYAEAQR